jgi:hypothetical protein
MACNTGWIWIAFLAVFLGLQSADIIITAWGINTGILRETNPLWIVGWELSSAILIMGLNKLAFMGILSAAAIFGGPRLAKYMPGVPWRIIILAPATAISIVPVVYGIYLLL